MFCAMRPEQLLAAGGRAHVLHRWSAQQPSSRPSLLSFLSPPRPSPHTPLIFPSSRERRCMAGMGRVAPLASVPAQRPPPRPVVAATTPVSESAPWPAMAAETPGSPEDYSLFLSENGHLSFENPNYQVKGTRDGDSQNASSSHFQTQG